MAHKHAALMALYAQDAAETDRPWERWEGRVLGGQWFSLIEHPHWHRNHEYRRKPKTITVNGFEVPEPLKEMPKDGVVWLVMPHAEKYTDQYNTHPMPWKVCAMQRGLLHTTQEAAVAHAKAMLGIDPGESA